MNNKTNILRKKAELQRKLIIQKSRKDFYLFLRFMFPNKDVSWNWHHKYVCGLLQDFVLGDIDNLMIFMPPQHQKSTMMTEYLPAWLFGVNPNAEALLIMYNATMAAKYNRKIQRIIDNPLYKEIFPDTKLNEKNVVSTEKGSYIRNSEEFQIVGHRGFLKATGVGGGIAGNPAKFTFMDDVIKNVAEANSQTFRDKTYDWQTDELEARQHNDSKIAFTITRRHDDDLAGRLIKRDGLVENGGVWKVVVLPALKENNENLNDPREIGEALFPKLHSRRRMEKIRDRAPRTFTGLYQQRPTPEKGNIIQKDWFVIVNEWDLPPMAIKSQKRMAVDTADKTKQENDPSAYCVYSEYRNKVIIWSYWEGRLPFSQRNRKFAEGYKEYECRIMKIEPKSSGVATVQHLDENSPMNVIEAVNPEGDKVTRLKSISEEIEAGRVILVKSNWNEKFINSITGFPALKHDEAVDVLVMAVNDTIKGSNRFGIII